VIEKSNPEGMHTPPGYHQVTVSGATPMVFLAGQCPLDLEGRLVGPGDLLAQADQVLRNIGTALASVGVGPADVVRTVIYIVSAEREDLSAVWARLHESDLAEAFTSASTLLGVSQLGFPSQLLEIDVTAALTR
jgi:enamine deaminase RidA (YjgF/YER057c/UK114 family)